MFRSLIFVPSNSERYLNKAKILNADIVCLDLEDSVPIVEKEQARQLIKAALATRSTYRTKNIYVRVNSFDTGLTFNDLKAVIQKGIDGIVLPKVNDENEISVVDRILSTLEQEIGIQEKTIKIGASIESAKGVVNSYSIAKASDRVNMLIFGVFDFLNDMHLDYIWQKIDDISGLKKDASLARRLGYAGKSLIHPSQIEIVHEEFIPSRSEIEWATKVVKALDEESKSGGTRGALRLEGKMIDAVHYKQAKAILEDVDENR